MEAVREITQWDVQYKQPNHTYLIDGAKLVAYIPYGQKSPTYFSKPMMIDRRGRKFVKVTPNPFKGVPKSNLIEVQGSRGDSYFVDPELKTCTCSGFQFRGKCKHLSVLSE